MATTSNASFTVFAKKATLTYSDGDTNTELFDLPANSYVVDVIVDVITAFSGGASQQLDVGIKNADGTDADYFANNVDISSTGRASVTLLKGGRDLGDRPVTVTAQASADDNTAGSVNITVLYFCLTGSHLH